MKDCTVFTREQQAAIFRASCEELPVHVTTLRSLGNFKGAFLGAGRVYKVPNITVPRSFELMRDGPNVVRLGMKENIHSSRYTGMTADGAFEGAALPLFNGNTPYIEEAPPFELKTVDPEVIRRIRNRHETVQPNLVSLYPGGESLTFFGDADRPSLSDTGYNLPHTNI